MNKLLKKVITLEAYQEAARAMCDGCAKGDPVEKFFYGDRSYSWIHRALREECEASPIHDLIAKLNEAKMNHKQQIDWLLQVNDSETGAAAVMENIIRLIMGGYEVTFSGASWTGVPDEDGVNHDLPAVRVAVARDGEWVFEETDVRVSDAMTQVYQMTPEVNDESPTP